MLEILLDPNGAPLDPRLPAHDAIHNLLGRCLPDAPSCACPAPWVRLHVAERWQDGRLAVSGLQACCQDQERRALRGLPAWMLTLEKSRNGFPPPPVQAIPSTARLLLEDIRSYEDLPLPGSAVVRPTLLRGRHDSWVVEGDSIGLPDGTRFESLLLRSVDGNLGLTKALLDFRPVEVVAYWRPYGFDWGPHSVRAAQRFRVGVGGSFTARLTRLFPDHLPPEEASHPGQPVGARDYA